MKFKLNNKGVSLPMTVGLLLLLAAMTATVNELVIRALRSSHQIEAADKAYFAAEAGIENALYELSAHTAGYETGTLTAGAADARIDEFSDNSIRWHNQWEIKDKDLNTCSDTLKDWELGFLPKYCGRLYQGDKLVLNFFADDAQTIGVGQGAINEAAQDVNTLSVNSITIRFRLPVSLVKKYPTAFNVGLLIDNDGDLGASSKAGPIPYLGLNEDGPAGFPGFSYAPNICPYSVDVAVDDNDCDLLEDEDSPADPVLMWKMVDSSGHSFQPLRGCKGMVQDPSHAGHNNAIMCERSFSMVNNELSVTMNETDEGTDQDGDIVSLQTFLSGYTGSHDTLQMEILVVAPLQAVSYATGQKISIPYLEYGITYNIGGGLSLPATFFSLKSDGYYQDFKQSITTNVVPRATTRLLDLTIIQQ